MQEEGKLLNNDRKQAVRIYTKNGGHYEKKHNALTRTQKADIICWQVPMMLLHVMIF